MSVQKSTIAGIPWSDTGYEINYMILCHESGFGPEQWMENGGIYPDEETVAAALEALIDNKDVRHLRVRPRKMPLGDTWQEPSRRRAAMEAA